MKKRFHILFAAVALATLKSVYVYICAQLTSGNRKRESRSSSIRAPRKFRSRISARLLTALVGILVISGGLPISPATALISLNGTLTFTSSGDFVVPANVISVVLQAQGAPGGTGGAGGGAGGLGGRATVSLSVTEGEILHVHVNEGGGAGGFSGGGGDGEGAAGGGASDVRAINDSLLDRVIVAGGGGGGGGTRWGGTGGIGGVGGGGPGGDGPPCSCSYSQGGGGGTQTAGGAGGYGAMSGGGSGGSGYGGDGAYYGGGGGGGGYYGGGGGGAAGSNAGGGGGSNFIGVVPVGTSELGVSTASQVVIAWQEVVSSNNPPNAPNLVSPPDGKVFQGAELQSFAINAGDPDGNFYTGKVTIRDGSGAVVTTVLTSPAASGQDSTGVPTPPLPAGNYTWTAQAVDGAGATSATSAQRSFSVLPNHPPNSPSLVSPSSGHIFQSTDPQTFTINTTDPDGDPYIGTITITNSGTGAVNTVITSSAPSGQDSSGVAVPPLAAGNYTWSATATDGRAQSGSSASRSFTVSALPANNAPAVPTLISPATSAAFGPNDPQVFTINTTDPDGDPYIGTITITNSGTGTITTVITSPAPTGQNSSGAAVPPLAPGSYTWSATATDAKGARSGASSSRSFTVSAPPANNAPNVPALVSPANGATFAPTDPQTFTINTTDPDGDPYTGTVTIRNGSGSVVATFTTSPSPSGQSSSGTPAPLLAAGSYTWSATATDAKGAQSGSSSSRSFTVSAPPANNAPNVPALVSPANGATFAPTDPQTFTINATDQEGDPYTGTITVRNGGGSVVATFTTSPTPSGQNSTGTPTPPLPTGSYTWSATATDAKGALSGASSSRSFTVGSLVIANNPPTAPVLISPPEGKIFSTTEPQRFSINTTDPESDSYTGAITVRNASSGTVVATFNTSAALSGFDSSGAPTPPLPYGSYTWTAQATDTKGATSLGSAVGTFSVGNHPPLIPNLVSPAPASGLSTTGPQAFTINASDPDGDPYTGTVTIRGVPGGSVVTSFITSAAPSGQGSTGTPAPLLAAGNYTWSAHATDPGGANGLESQSRAFSVGANQPPSIPLLISPAPGATFYSNTPQTFQIQATDPDGDPYFGTVTIIGPSGSTSVTTSPASSGAFSSGAPTTPLAPGDYTWRAAATDAKLATGSSSVSRSFTVTSAITPVPSEIPSDIPTTLASVNTQGSQLAGQNFSPSISADGRYVAFSSPNGTGTKQIYVRDRLTGQTALASTDKLTGTGNGDSINPSISSSGRYVAFESSATNFGLGDYNGHTDIFVADLLTQSVTKITLDYGGAISGPNGDSSLPAISADGTYVAYSSFASNLVSSDTGSVDVFVTNQFTGATDRASVDSSGNQSNGNSWRPAFSGDGNYVAFISYASNLVSGDTNGYSDVFVHNRTTGATQRVSVDSSGTQGNDYSLSTETPSVSNDGRYVAFFSRASNLVSGDTNGQNDIFVRDRTAGATSRVSTSSTGAQANDSSSSPYISSDGRYVAFASNASNLAAGDRNGSTDVFLKDRSSGVTTLITHDPGGLQANGSSFQVAMSSDGLQLAFASMATNLVLAPDANFDTDIFAYNRQLSLTCAANAISAVGCLSGYGFKASSDKIGLEEFYPYRSFDLGSDTAYVNMANGNLVVQSTDLDAPGQGLNMRLTRTYNSQRDQSPGPLGKGWRIGVSDGEGKDLLGGVVSAVMSADVGQLLEIVATEDQFDFFDADGTRHHFLKGGLSGPGWHSPPGVNLTMTDFLVGVDHHYKAVRPDGVSYDFAPVSGSWGLVAIADRKGNQISFSYSSGRLASATDPTGRVMNFNWSGDYLSSITFGGTTVNYSVNSATGRLDSSTFGGRTVSYSYNNDVNSSNLGMASATDGRGNSTSFTLQGGMATQITDRGGKAWAIAYNTNTCQPSDQRAAIAACVTSPDPADPLPHVTTYTSSADGNLLSVRDPGDPSPETKSYLWQANRLASATDEAGNTAEYSYNQNGQITLKRESGNGEEAKTSAFTYRDVSPGVADLTQAIIGTGSSDQRIWNFGVNEDGTMSSVTDPAGKATTFNYISGGRLSSVTDPNGHATSYSSYGATGQPGTITDSLSHSKSISYNLFGEPTSITDRDGNAWTYGYDGRGNMTSGSTPNGTSNFGYDANDNQTSSTPAAGATTNRTFDARDLITESSATVDGTLRKTTYVYYQDGELKEVNEPRTYAGSPTVTQKVNYTRFPNNRVSAFIDEEGNQTDLTYTPEGYIRTVVDPLGATGRHTATYSYNRMGQATSVTESGHQNPTTYTYNLHGEQTAQKNPKGEVTSFSYDKMGRPTIVIDPAGHTSARTYDPAGNLVTLTQPKDSGGQLTTSYSYTPRNEISRESDPADGSHTIEYAYDNEGYQTYRYDKYNGTTERTIAQTFRGDGKVASRNASGTGLSAHNSSYVYDGAGNLTSASTTLGGSNVSSISVGYNGAYQPTSYSETVYDTGGTARTKSSSYSYQPDGLLASRTVDGQTTNYGYLRNALEQTVTPWGGAGSFANEYNPNGTLKKTTMPNGAVIDQLFDPADRLTSRIVHRNDLTMTPLSSWTGIAYDDNDNRTSEHVAQRQIESSPVPPLTLTGNDSYSYDNVDRLTSYHSALDQKTTNYTLDNAGNVLQDADATYSYQNNRLTTLRPLTGTVITPFTYTYDHMGNAVSETQAGSTTSTNYDAASHTKRVTASDASWVEFTYDGLDRMVRRQTSTGEINLFFHDGPTDQIALETNNGGTATTRYILDSGGDPVGKEDIGNSTGRSYFIEDPRGNVTQLIDQNQGVMAVFGYDPYGKDRSSPIPGAATRIGNWDSRLRFQKAPRDPKTGAYNIGPRVLNPNINRFVGADMYVAAAANMDLQLDPLTGNRYLYAGVNPNFIDDGHGVGCPKFLKKACKAVRHEVRAAVKSAVRKVVSTAKADMKAAVNSTITAAKVVANTTSAAVGATGDWMKAHSELVHNVIGAATVAAFAVCVVATAATCAVAGAALATAKFAQKTAEIGGVTKASGRAFAAELLLSVGGALTGGGVASTLAERATASTGKAFVGAAYRWGWNSLTTTTTMGITNAFDE
jgi:RHS repeat-associated protein